MADAQRWIDRAQLRREDIAAGPLNLERLFEGHPSEGRYRLMIYQAADRIIGKRGGSTNLNEYDQRHYRA